MNDGCLLANEVFKLESDGTMVQSKENKLIWWLLETLLGKGQQLRKGRKDTYIFKCGLRGYLKIWDNMVSICEVC